MTRTTALLRAAAAGFCAVSLAGCISLLPKSKPSTLYRFGQPTNAEAAPPVRAGRVGVLRAGGSFQPEAAGDRILTVTDGKVAYVAETRWAAPAAVLWDEALNAAFDSGPGGVRLLARGQPGSADYILRIEVRNFEAHYDAGPKAAPTVLVRVKATLLARTGTAAGETMIDVQEHAADNRVGAIVEAYDKAVREALGKLVAWTDAQAKGSAA
jgi:cholesterol transport system auxiliary component